MSRLAILLTLFTLACGNAESTDTTTNQESTTPTAAASAAAETAGPIDFTDEDLDLYARGIVQETAIVKAALERASSAATPAERSKAAQESWEEQSVPAAAKAAGIAEDRYRHTRAAVHEVFETLDFQGKIDGPLEMDLTRVSDDVKAQLAKDPFEALTPSAAAALRARMDRLVPAWIEYTSLVAVNG